MSSSAIPVTTTTQSPFLVERYVSWICFALVSYEFIALLHREYLFLWHRKWTGVTWLLLANRYFTIGIVLSNILPTGPKMYVPVQDASSQLGLICTRSDFDRCHDKTAVGFLAGLLGFTPSVIATGFSALRAFALSRSVSIGIVVLMFGLVSFVTDCYGLSFNLYYYVVPVDNLAGHSDDSVSYVLNRLALSVIISEGVVVVVTWVTTFRQARLDVKMDMRSLSTTLLRDGNVYFITLLVWSILQLLLHILPAGTLLDTNFINVWITAIQPILISRFILDLRHTADRNRGSSVGQENPSQVASRVRFRLPTLTVETIVGPMGEPLETEHRDIWEEEQDMTLGGPEPTAEHASQEGAGHPLSAAVGV